ncbi:hypothetical protein N7449_000262 [Penicillium cf. viridicatum]|uniref:Uncharacterized protein n=1 Tax=Penicillium cf. viridicatum TaxID=2972119 RepID=A0A9W9T847_9EURO|nr:hypothetical protein N7449_000262 [Penicillium cf. viridicatum]
MSGSQDETGLGTDDASIPGSAFSSPIIERSESATPDIQPHGSVAAPTRRPAIYYLDQVQHHAGLGNPSPLTPRPESMVHTHASINPQPMAANLAPSDLTMAEGHRPRQYAYYQGQHGPQIPMVGHQNQLSAGLSMDTQGPRSYSQHPATQLSIPGLTLIQRPAPANNTSTSSMPSYTHGQPVWVHHPSRPHARNQRRYRQRPPTRPSIPGLTLIQDPAPADNTFTASDVPASPSVPANSAGDIPRSGRVTPPWRRPL